MKLETIAIHAGNQTDKDSRAVIQPITLSTTFERGEDGGYPAGFMYTRADNPNRKSLENVLAKLEGGEAACAFSSGNAAANAVFQSLAPGSHVIAPLHMYHGLRTLINQVYAATLDIDYIDLADLQLLERTIRPNTRLIWVETPSNPLLSITGIKAVCVLAKPRDILVCCDNTFATPAFQQPLQLGADLVMHSTTKYLSGHSDVLGGAIITAKKNPFWEKIRTIQAFGGAVPSPFDCYMTVRGIKTFPYRMAGHAKNAQLLAEFLDSHKMVEAVYYPGLKDHEHHNIALTQMSFFGGTLSFLVKGGADAARKIANSLTIFTQATSLGGVESLVEHRASVEPPDTKTPQNLLRVSVGLEHIDDLIADLTLALNNLATNKN